mgnify:FL=1
MRLLFKNIKIDKSMEDTKDDTKEHKKDIYNYIDILEIQKLLINYPQLCVMFELLCIHINNLINKPKLRKCSITERTNNS